MNKLLGNFDSTDPRCATKAEMMLHAYDLYFVVFNFTLWSEFPLRIGLLSTTHFHKIIIITIR